MSFDDWETIEAKEYKRLLQSRKEKEAKEEARKRFLTELYPKEYEAEQKEKRKKLFAEKEKKAKKYFSAFGNVGEQPKKVKIKGVRKDVFTARRIF